MAGTRSKVKWMPGKLDKQVGKTMRRRLQTAGEFLRGRIVQNISIPTRSSGPSKAGEFPHADEGKLRQSIFSDLISDDTCIVGTPLKYGRILELHRDRSFLRRTLKEEQRRVKRILEEGRRS